MSEQYSLRERTPERIEEFIKAFFGPGNTVWPDQRPDSAAGRNLVPFLQILRETAEVPVVLPRRRPDSEHQLTAYVIALDPAHATTVAELLTAFVGPSYSTFDGLPANLDPGDPVDRAVMDFAGPATAFIVSSPTSPAQAQAWSALQQLQATVKSRPMRVWHAPKPAGRLIAEFEVALAAGDNSASAEILQHLGATGLSASNIAYLRIKRLARLGRDGELLRMPGLADIVAANPPEPVKDSILAAIYNNVLAPLIEEGNLAAAQRRLVETGEIVPALLIDCEPSSLGEQALVVVALAALLRKDALLLARLTSNPAEYDRILRIAPALADAINAASGLGAARPSQEIPSPETPTRPSSWLALITAITKDPAAAAAVLRDDTWRDWDPPALQDTAIAAALAGLDDAAAEQAWSLVGPFLDADGYQRPAALSARELINNALAYSRFSPGDLAGLVALTEITLRSAPGAATYASLLDDLRAECGRWASPDRAVVVLDLADLLARAASPDPEARLRIVLALLRPLVDHHLRLDPDQDSLARQLARELETGLQWPEGDEPSSAPLVRMPPLNLLLYSLDEGVLQRVSAVLGGIAPSLKIKLSHDHVGSPRLRQLSRQADVIVLATRCATHAATGFIRANAAHSAYLTEADGSGSASLLRAAVAGVEATLARSQ